MPSALRMYLTLSGSLLASSASSLDGFARAGGGGGVVDVAGGDEVGGDAVGGGDGTRGRAGAGDGPWDASSGSRRKAVIPILPDSSVA